MFVFTKTENNVYNFLIKLKKLVYRIVKKFIYEKYCILKGGSLKIERGN